MPTSSDYPKADADIVTQYSVDGCVCECPSCDDMAVHCHNEKTGCNM